MLLQSPSEYYELINPVTSSAKGAMDMLLTAEVPEAAELAGLLGYSIPERTSSMLQKNPALAEAISAIYAVRYHAINYYIERTGIKNIVDLGCGYSPRGLLYLNKPGYTYIGIDLPAVIKEVRKINGNLNYQAVDITNSAALVKVFSKLEGKVLIITEDVLPYLTLSELKMVISNIRDVLMEHLGIWMTADFEGADYTAAVVKALFDANRENGDKPSVCVSAGPEFLSECGFDVKKVPFLNEHILYKALPKQSMEKLLRLLDKYRQFEMSFYYLSKSAEALKEQKPDSVQHGSGDFSFQVQKGEDSQTYVLRGRLDTVTSPDLLSFYENYCDFKKSIILDCKDLEYISSAGIRVFLIMYKRNNQKVKIINTNEMVSEVLEQTGISGYFCG